MRRVATLVLCLGIALGAAAAGASAQSEAQGQDGGDAAAAQAAAATHAAGDAQAGHGGNDGHGDGDGDDGERTAAEIFLGLYKHLEPHAVAALWWGGQEGFGLIKPFVCDRQGNPLVLDAHGHPVTFHSTAELNAHYRPLQGGGGGILIYNINTSMWIAAALVLAVFVGLARSARRRGTEAPKGATYNILESIVLFVRDDMVYSVMGRDRGRRFVPLFLTQFFFILFMNILGLVWLGDVGGTATANLAVTGGLALTTLLWINLAGIREHGFIGYWRNYAPHGLPFFVLPIIVLIEVASAIVIKPAALTIRLFANMTAGHLVMLSLFGLIYLAGSAMAGIPALATFALVLAIACLELFVAFVQAYIFTYLSVIFVGASVHPEH
jgi:F-type H+-transporting ATPase subunit a